jgi:hypothetical protein
MKPYLAYYLEFGLISTVLTFIYVQYFEKTGEPFDFKKAWRDLQTNPLNFDSLINNELMIAFLALMVAIVGWPWFFYFAAKEKLKDRRQKQEEMKFTFSVLKQDLVEKLSISEIEYLEIVNDPLGAVPKVPFGHINIGWLTFKEKMSHSDEIWRYEKDFINRDDHTEKHEGYAIVKDNNIKEYFSTSVFKIHPKLEESL